MYPICAVLARSQFLAFMQGRHETGSPGGSGGSSHGNKSSSARSFHIEAAGSARAVKLEIIFVEVGRFRIKEAVNLVEAELDEDT